MLKPNNMIKHFWRELKSGQLTLLILCLIVAVAASTSVGFFSNRIQNALGQQSNELLAGDLKMTSSQPIGANYIELARKNSLDVATFESMQGVVSVENNDNNEKNSGEASGFTLVDIKAVSNNYPLRGKLKTKIALLDDEIVEANVPKKGTIWVDVLLFNQMRFKIGQSVNLGDKTFILDKVLTFEPDRGGDVFNIAPRVMIHEDDLSATKLVMPGSRIRYVMLLKGDAIGLGAFQESFKEIQQALKSSPEQSQDIRLQTIDDTQPTLKAALLRADNFMNLTALISIALACCGVALSAHQFAQKHRDTVAIMSALGISKRTILSLFGGMLLLVSILSSLIGILIAYVFQIGLVNVLANLVIQTQLPAPSFIPAFVGMLIGVICTLGFAMPPILALRHIAPMNVLRRDFSVQKREIFMRYLPAYFLICFLFIWRAGSIQLGLLSVLSLTVSLMLFAFLGEVLLSLLKHIPLHSWAKIGQKNILTHKKSSVLQMSVIGFSIMILLLLTLVRQDLLNAWTTSLPANAPNQFMINVPSNQVADIQSWIYQNRDFVGEHNSVSSKNAKDVANQVENQVENKIENQLANQSEFNKDVPKDIKDIKEKIIFYPLVRGRISTWNGQNFSSDLYQEDDAKRMAKREYNFSWSKELPKGNTLMSGDFPPLDMRSQNGEMGISIEDKLAERFGFKLGDRVSFIINGEEISTQITSFRKIDWESVNANFFILFPHNALDHIPVTWMSAFYWPKAQQFKLSQLIKKYPTLTMIDVSDLTDRIKGIIERVSLAISAIFLFTLLAGILVLFVALQTTQSTRIREIALFKTFGTKRRILSYSLLAEFTILGALAGILAGLFSYIVCFVLMKYIFNLEGFPSPLSGLVGIVLGIFVVLISGYLGCRRFLDRSPMDILKNQL